MRLLVLGGTVFLGRAVARHARDAGHDVVCAARGTSGEPVDGVSFVRIDRSRPDGLAAIEGTFDAVVDVARHPSQIRHAIGALAGRVGHATFVSSASVYSDTAVADQTVETTPVYDAPPPDFDDPTSSPEAYGRCKVLGEQLYREAFPGAFVCRAGLIVGAEDPSGRFEYWVARAKRGGEVLAPGGRDDAVQLVDVADLAAWIVSAAQTGLSGTYNGSGRPVTRAAFLQEVFGAFDTTAELTWVPQEFLTEHEVAPWSGSRSIPLWLPLPEYAGFMRRNVDSAFAAGLTTRPLAETVRATAAWMGDGRHPNGLTPQEEAAVLRAWHEA